MRHMDKIETDQLREQYEKESPPLPEANNSVTMEYRPAIPNLGLLLKAVRRNEFTPKSVLHGEQHWKRVTLSGLWIADRVPGADREVIYLFGLLHDCRRQDDGADLSHGPRAAKEAVNFQEAGLIDLEPNRMAVLVQALSEHTFGRVSDNPTIGCCWDADRYDVLRVFQTVNLQSLSHPNVATPERLDAAFYKPEPVEQSWLKLLQKIR
jgi:uncharacterized protein